MQLYRKEATILFSRTARRFDMWISDAMNPLRERLQRVLDLGYVADKKAWALDAGLSDGFVRSWMSQAKDDEARSMNVDSVEALARVAKVNRAWLAFGEGEPRGGLSPKDDARRWFVHRVVDGGLGTAQQAEAWLDGPDAPPWNGQTVAWNTKAFVAFRERREGAPSETVGGASLEREVDRADPRRAALSALRTEFATNANAVEWLDQYAAAFAGEEVDWMTKLRTDLATYLSGKEVGVVQPMATEHARQAKRTKTIKAKLGKD